MNTKLLLPLGTLVCSLGLLGAGCGDSTTDSGGGGHGGSTATNHGGQGASGGEGAAGPGGAGGAGGGTGGGGEGGTSLSHADCSAPTGAPGALKLTPLAMDLTTPLEVVHVPGDDDRLYIVQQPGYIGLLKGGQVTPFLDISSKVTYGGEQGFLGVAFHPNYLENGRFFVYYTSKMGNPGDGVVAEYKRSDADPDVADPTPVVEPMLQIPDFADNHNGGSMEFGPDGYLYLGIGDGGQGGDPMENGQNKTVLLAKLLRLDVDAPGMPYGIPPGNITDGAPEVFDWGLRNPFHHSFDLCTGDRYIGDVGQGQFEEIDVAPASQGPTNWGWDDCEGLVPYEGAACPGTSAPPITVYPHSGNVHEADCGYAVLGGFVYRGSAIPWLRGTYIYAEYCGGQTWTLKWENGSLVEGPTDITLDLWPNFPDEFHILTGFGQDNKGEIYVVDGFDGVVYRLDPE